MSHPAHLQAQITFLWRKTDVEVQFNSIISARDAIILVQEVYMENFSPKVRQLRGMGKGREKVESIPCFFLFF